MVLERQTQLQKYIIMFLRLPNHRTTLKTSLAEWMDWKLFLHFFSFRKKKTLAKIERKKKIKISQSQQKNAIL